MSFRKLEGDHFPEPPYPTRQVYRGELEGGSDRVYSGEVTGRGYTNQGSRYEYRRERDPYGLGAVPTRAISPGDRRGSWDVPPADPGR